MKRLLSVMLVVTMFTIALSVCVGGASAANYPTKPITLVIPFSPGGSGDIEPRVFARSLERVLGQPIIPTNMVGGSGALGLQHTMQAEPDGYTICFMSATIAFGMAHSNITYRPEEINVIGSFNADTMGIFVLKDSPFNTIEDLISYAKQNPERLLIGGTQAASAHHSLFLTLCNEADIEMQYVPFGGSGDTALAFLGGNLDGGIFSPAFMREYMESEGVRLLLYAAQEHDDDFEGVPIGKDLGFYMMDDLLQFRSYITTPGVPEEVMQIIDDAFEKAFNDPEYQKYLADLHITPFYQNRENFSNFLIGFVENVETILALIDEN